MTLYKWSKTAADNDDADSTINWLEGQAPSSVNDSARALMAAAAKYRDDISGMLNTAGSSTAFTITTNQTLSALQDGFEVWARLHTANGAAATLAVDGLTAKAIRIATSTALPSGALSAGALAGFTYDSGDGCWYVKSYISATALTTLDIVGGTALTAPATDDTLPIYDLSATANKQIALSDLWSIINSLTAETAPATDDVLALYDTSETAANSMTLANVLKVVNSLTEDTSPVPASDFLLSYDTSGSSAAKVTPQNVLSAMVASQAVMEAASSTTTAVTPGRQHFHPGHPKAGGSFHGDGTPAFASGDYGMGAITDNGTGDYTLAFDTSFSNTNYWINGWARDDNDTTNAMIVSGGASDTKAVGSFEVTTWNGSAVADSPEICVSFWGDYA